MPVEQSILNSTKKILGLDAGYTAFDLDVITHINSAFFTLNQLGVGSPDGFMIDGDEEEWDDFTHGNVNLNAVKSYMFLKVKSMFDPPGTPHHLTALNEQLTELEHRLKMERSMRSWAAPGSLPGMGDYVIQGGDLDA